MDLDINIIYLLCLVFFCVAFFYSSVGLGGGSSYTAVLAIAGFDTATIPLISLSLNLIVTSAGSFNFIRNQHAKISLLAPFLVTSMPMAYWGGSLKLPKILFFWILFFSLLFVVLKIYFFTESKIRWVLSSKRKIFLSLVMGAVLGLLAGIAGIGGGIYLVPLIIISGLGTEKEAAASGAIFIMLNSMAGLVSRIYNHPFHLLNFLPLVFAVLIGGTFGSFLGSFKLRPRTMERILGVVIIVAVLFLGRKIAFF